MNLNTRSFRCLISGEVWVPKRMKISNDNVRKYVNIIFGKKSWNVKDATKEKNRNVHPITYICNYIKFIFHMDWLKWTNLPGAKEVVFYVSTRTLRPLGLFRKMEKNDT